jgi:mannose-6-phosphate isomerase-like protein (cupin superfamily)
MQTIKWVLKPWGKEEILATQDKYVVKRLYILKGKRCSFQYHKNKTETVYVLSGTLLLHLDRQIITMQPGDFRTIMPGEIHRMEGGEDAIYLESSTPELDNVVRIADDYNRE